MKKASESAKGSSRNAAESQVRTQVPGEPGGAGQGAAEAVRKQAAEVQAGVDDLEFQLQEAMALLHGQAAQIKLAAAELDNPTLDIVATGCCLLSSRAISGLNACYDGLQAAARELSRLVNGEAAR